MRRSSLENGLIHYLKGNGWQDPTLRTQRAAFPKCTPAAASGGKGRGSIVFDLERLAEGGILVANCVGLKATAGPRPDTIAVTTGTEPHCEQVINACNAGLDVPIIVVRMIDPVIEDEEILGFEGIEATVLRFGAKLREHWIVERTSGQGKGRGEAAPIAWGRKAQKSPGGKVYSYVTLQANLRACGATWVTLRTLADLERFISEHAEGVIL